MGIRIEEYRLKNNVNQQVLAQKLGISVPTLARIEAAEREGKKYRITRRKAEGFLRGLSDQLGCEVTMDDLDHVVIAPLRPGRPKRVSGEKLMRFNAHLRPDGTVIFGIRDVAYQLPQDLFQKWLAANEAKLIDPHFTQGSILYEVEELKVLPDDMS